MVAIIMIIEINVILWLVFIRNINVIHLGINPNKGGIPAIDIIRTLIKNFLYLLFIFHNKFKLFFFNSINIIKKINI